MARINFQGEGFEVPNQVNGTDIRQLLGTSAREIPVRVRDDGYEPVKDNKEYFIEDEAQFDKVNRLANG